VLLIGALLTWGLAGVAQAAGSGEALYRFGPRPQWVREATADYGAPVPASGVPDGAWELLLDRQISVNPDGEDFYDHSAVLVTNASGVDERSQIDIEVDPNYQVLTLHAVHVVRQGRVIDQKPLARITALPQETELRERVYNGTYNVNILLADVRVGDVVEYDYTLHSVEHVFPGMFAARLSIGWSVPMHRERVRVLAPVSQQLFYRTEDASAPITSVHDGVRELAWEWHDRKPVAGDDDRPRWYSVWPHLEVTNVRSWNEIARRETQFFEVRPVGSAALAQVVGDIRHSGGTPADQALHALQFVQDQIRYVSISIGRGGFVPSAPETILERRFGDCKDKSLLLATLLRELGIDARVALVNTRRGRTLSSSLPSPFLFDHAIVRMQLDRQTYWLDGTAGKQYSPLSPAAPADFERALVVDPATTDLEVIPRPEAGASSRTSTVSVDLSAGYDKPAQLKISTFYQGAEADRLRQRLADETSAKRQSNYLNYIVSYYPDARTAAPVEIHDDTAHDVIEVRESYTLQHPFKRADDGHWEIFLQADEMYRYLEELKSSVRSGPLAIAYPIDVRQTVHAILPDDIPIHDETVTVDDPAFRYESVVSHGDAGGRRELTLDYHYRSLTDYVNVADLPGYQKDRSRAYDDTGFYVRSNAGVYASVRQVKVAEAAALPRWVTYATFVLAISLGLRFLLRWNPRAAPSELNWPVGIRGWLWLAAVAVILTPFGIGWMHYADVMGVLDAQHWNRLPSIVPAPWSEWAACILLALTAWGALLVVFHFALLCLFFMRRTSVPLLFIGLNWMTIFYVGLVWAVMVGFHLREGTDAVRFVLDLLASIAATGGFTLYFLRSKRVKATFVRHYSPRMRRWMRSSTALGS
jgi:transglutaminase-like putative cysteine protease